VGIDPRATFHCLISAEEPNLAAAAPLEVIIYCLKLLANGGLGSEPGLKDA